MQTMKAQKWLNDKTIPESDYKNIETKQANGMGCVGREFGKEASKEETCEENQRRKTASVKALRQTKPRKL